jgi:hypothetical protein
MLWSASVMKGYSCPLWLTFKQALELGGNVKKGEHGELVVYANRITRTETNEAGEETEREIPVLKGYTVFNAEQCDGLPAHYSAKAEPPTLPPAARIERADQFFVATGADIRVGGTRAYYAEGPDYVQVPPFETSVTPRAMPPRLRTSSPIMPTSGVCRAEHRFPRFQGCSGAAIRHNQRASRNASNLSSGRYLPGPDAGAVMRASAFSLRRRSACM